MSDLETAGKILLALGIIFLVVGTILCLGNRIGLGNLPGDINIKKDNHNLIFPIASIGLITAVIIFISFILNAVFKK